MKILIVDDNVKKSNEIEEVLNNMTIPNCDICIARSIVSCTSRLSEEQFDVLILDEQLPISDCGEVIEFGGIEIIKTLKQDPSLNKPQKIIYLSAFTESLERITNLMAHSAILYQEDSEEWKAKLKEIIMFELATLAQKRRQYLYDIVLITTTDIEYSILEELSQNWRNVKIPGDSARYIETEWIRDGKIYKVVATKLNQMGMSAAATVTSKMIYEFVPRFIAMCGIAGGVEKDADLGDIIVATKVWDYCSGKYDTPEVDDENNFEQLLSGAIRAFKPTSNTINANAQIVNMQAKNYDDTLNNIFRAFIPSKTERPPKIWWGSLACGNSVVKNPAIVKEMVCKFDRKTLGIDMESYGVFYAVENAIGPKPKAVCIKAISDFADKAKNDGYQKYAAYVSGHFTKVFLMDLLDEAE